MLEELIKEGQEIRETITFIQPRDGVMRINIVCDYRRFARYSEASSWLHARESVPLRVSVFQGGFHGGGHKRG